MDRVVLSINLGNFGSTGTILRGISKTAKKNGYTVYQAYPAGIENKAIEENDIIICSERTKKISQRLSRYTGFNGMFARCSTLRFLKEIANIKPDIIHFHNLHNSYINLPLLFKYIKKKNIPVVWTLHDCWSFTGHCTHFMLANCNKWKTQCFKCPQFRDYPYSSYDNTKKMWKLKRKWFNGVNNLTIVTPSKWLADLTKQSFLKEYPIKVINNGIDLNVFKPSKSDFLKKHNLENKFIVLGVAFGWGVRKGLDTFIKLSKRLDEKLYKIVLVGTDDSIDSTLPSNILSIHRTQNQAELAAIYSAANLFVNPTREDNFPTVNIEALACGTPVITFDVGGSAEMLSSNCGHIVKSGDFEDLVNKIEQSATNLFDRKACQNKAKQYLDSDKFKEYVNLYNDNLE